MEAKRLRKSPSHRAGSRAHWKALEVGRRGGGGPYDDHTRCLTLRQLRLLVSKPESIEVELALRSVRIFLQQCG